MDFIYGGENASAGIIATLIDLGILYMEDGKICTIEEGIYKVIG